LAKGVEFLLKKNNMAVVKATAAIASAGRLAVSDGADIQAKNIVVATGSRPFILPGCEFDEEQVLSSTGILDMQELPKNIVILGAGAIGCEFALVMHAFGVHVTLVEMVDHILPLEDEETVAELEKSFRRRGIKVLTSTRALSLEKGPEGVTVALAGKNGAQHTVAAEKVLCVFGCTPNTDAIGLENVGLETERGYIPVGEYCQTRAPGIFAIGDVVNTPLLAHVASKEGEIVVEYIDGNSPEPRIDVNQIPSAIYCEPQVAGFGLRENQAREQAVAYQKSVFPYRGVGKPIAVGKAEGMVKILYDPESTQILGGHIVGHGATELIHEVLLAKCAGLLPKDVANMIHAHPTVCEAIMEAMRGVAGQPIHT